MISFGAIFGPVIVFVMMTNGIDRNHFYTKFHQGDSIIIFLFEKHTLATTRMTVRRPPCLENGKKKYIHLTRVCLM